MNQSPSLEDELKDVFLSSFRFYSASFREIISIFLVPFLILALMKLAALPYVTNKEMLLYYLLAQLTVTPLINAIVILFIYAKSEQKQVSALVLYQTAFKFWPGLLAIFFIISGLGYLGLLLFIIPGIWIIMRLILSDIIFIVEKPDIKLALQASLERSADKFWLILMSLLLAITPLFLGGQLLHQIYLKLGEMAPVYILMDLILSFSFLFIHIILFRIYMMTKDGYTLET